MHFVEWITGKLPVLIFALIIVAQVVRGFLRSGRDQPKPTAKPDELEAQRRIQEVQEQIRRRIAERRVIPPRGDVPAREMRPPEPRPFMPRPETLARPDPFGGALRRRFEELEPKPPVPVVPPPLVKTSNAELERQQQLADQLRSVKDSRLLEQRRAAHLAADRATEAQSEEGLRASAHDRLIEDLADPASVRRAFILREVLGPPLALR
jgi:hypothetical protein